jgi:hypothetical protein
VTTTVGARERTWLAADVPTEIAQEFYELARAQHRSGAAHLRHLIREYVSSTSESPAGQPSSRDNSGVEAAGNAAHEG